jgi:signal transduction histidine kinase
MNDAFRLLFDQVKSGVVWAARDGNVRYANKSAVQLTPCLLGRPFPDPMIARTVKAAGDNLVKLPFEFEFRTDETHPDTVRAVIIPAPVGNDLMLVLHNVSEERWYSQALENLIHYIEAEMAQPIEQLVTELGRLAPGGAAAGAQSVTQATAQELSGKLGKLRDLVSVFGADAIRRDERVMVPALVRESLKVIGALAQERSINLRLEGLEVELPPIYGSQTWLRRAMAEYLEHVLRKARGGSEVELSVQAIGTRVLVRSRNRGLFVSSHERRSAFVPFEAGDGKPAQSVGIGLALARYIVEQHGGSVRIEDEFDAVDFVMELPAGAPATQDAQISIEQAQRYARDMSQLLARSMSRQKKPAPLGS